MEQFLIHAIRKLPRGRELGRLWSELGLHDTPVLKDDKGGEDVVRSLRHDYLEHYERARGFERLIVALDPPSVRWQGQEHRLARPELACYIQLLLKQRTVVSFLEAVKECGVLLGTRPDRVYNELPTAIQELISKESPRGYCLIPAALPRPS